MSAEYWLGVITLPMLALSGAALFVGYVRVTMWLERRHGISFEVKMKRDAEGISEYTLRNDIWWERTFGPVFVGCWFREHGPSHLATRWVALGRTSAPCVIAFRREVLK